MTESREGQRAILETDTTDDSRLRVLAVYDTEVEARQKTAILNRLATALQSTLIYVMSVELPLPRQEQEGPDRWQEQKDYLEAQLSLRNTT